MRARDVTLNKSELQRGCENANKMCDGDANCIRKDFKSTDSDSLEFRDPIRISFEIKLRDHLVFGHNDSGGDYLYSYCPKDQADFVITNGAYSYNTYGGAAIDSGATHDCVAYCVDEDF